MSLHKYNRPGGAYWFNWNLSPITSDLPGDILTIAVGADYTSHIDLSPFDLKMFRRAWYKIESLFLKVAGVYSIVTHFAPS